MSASPTELLRVTPSGLYCEAGDFFIDPWGPADRAVITHAHSDHARAGSAAYLTSREGESLLRYRLAGGTGTIESVAWGEARRMNDVAVTLHPAGHIRGSAQVRLEHRGEVWVFTGDYKRAADPTCTPFELVRCHTLITEATFALPVYRWTPADAVFDDIVAWWTEVREREGCAILYTYTLGKAQRLLHGLAGRLPGPIWVHGAIEPLNAIYRDDGVVLGETRLVSSAERGTRLTGALVLAPPSATAPGWLRRFRQPETGFASGWMRVRGMRRRRGLDRGFAISDHADWPSLIRTIEETGAQRVLATHGDSAALVRYLGERGIDAAPLATPYSGEDDE